MVWSRSYGTNLKEEWIRTITPFFENTRVLPQRFRVDESEMEACLCTALEDEIEDFANISAEPERSWRDADYNLDLKELLFDETD